MKKLISTTLAVLASASLLFAQEEKEVKIYLTRAYQERLKRQEREREGLIAYLEWKLKALKGEDEDTDIVYDPHGEYPDE